MGASQLSGENSWGELPRYEQLKSLIERAIADAAFVRELNRGLNEVSGLLQSLRIEEPQAFKMAWMWADFRSIECVVWRGLAH